MATKQAVVKGMISKGMTKLNFNLQRFLWVTLCQKTSHSAKDWTHEDSSFERLPSGRYHLVPGLCPRLRTIGFASCFAMDCKLVKNLAFAVTVQSSVRLDGHGADLLSTPIATSEAEVSARCLVMLDLDHVYHASSARAGPFFLTALWIGSVSVAMTLEPFSMEMKKQRPLNG
jgi:hypothetical protein